MKAVIWSDYGGPDVLSVGLVDDPVPGPSDILLRVKATTVTAGDTEMRSLRFAAWVRIPMRLYMGYRRPRRVKIPGMAVAGLVEETGSHVTRFAVGEAVMAASDLRFGAHAELIRLNESAMISPIPEGLSFEEAACVPIGGTEALSFLDQARVRSGDRVFVNGAGGTIGSFIVQIARQRGAAVTAVDLAEKHDMLRDIGADLVLDHTRDELTVENGYDAVIDVVGKLPVRIGFALLGKQGRLVFANPRLGPLIGGVLRSIFSTKRVLMGAAKSDPRQLHRLKKMCEDGSLRPIIDRTFKLDDIAAAHAYAESGNKIGNIAITVAGDDPTISPRAETP